MEEDGENESAGGPRAALRVVRQRNFGLYFAGNATSATGTWFQNLAAQLLVYRLTHSAFLLGVLNFSYFIPTLVLFPWTGRVADRRDRRRVLLATQVLSTVLGGALALVAWRGHATAGLVIAVSAALGIVAAYTNTASGALLPLLVERDELAAAVALNSVTYNLARTLGPALAALAVKTLGIPAAFAINAASYLVLAAGLLFVRPRAQERAPDVRPPLRDSLTLLRGRPRLVAFLLIVTVVGFASDPVNTLAPAYARAFDHADTFAGALIGVFGLGAVTAAFILGGRVAASRGRMIVTLTALAVGVALFSVSPSLPVALVLLFVGGFGYLASNTGATARLQLEIEEAERGRITALWSVAFLGLRPFASIADGAIAGGFGVRAAGVVLAVPALLAAAGIVLLRDRARS